MCTIIILFIIMICICYNTKTVSANMNGQLTLRLETDTVTVTTYFKDLQNHHFQDTSMVDHHDKEAGGVTQTMSESRVDIRKFSQFLQGQFNPTKVICSKCLCSISHTHSLIIFPPIYIFSSISSYTLVLQTQSLVLCLLLYTNLLWYTHLLLSFISSYNIPACRYYQWTWFTDISIARRRVATVLHTRCHQLTNIVPELLLCITSCMNALHQHLLCIPTPQHCLPVSFLSQCSQ